MNSEKLTVDQLSYALRQRAIRKVSIHGELNTSIKVISEMVDPGPSGIPFRVVNLTGCRFASVEAFSEFLKTHYSSAIIGNCSYTSGLYVSFDLLHRMPLRDQPEIRYADWCDHHGYEEGSTLAQESYWQYEKLKALAPKSSD